MNADKNLQSISNTQEDKAMREYKVMASSIYGTFTVGRFVAESKSDACDQAKEEYRNSSLGQKLKDSETFTFFTVNKFPYEDDGDE